ncbi:glycerophosphodiester phosphodiesterase family protein [Chitinophaga sp. OAE865]|uniref:glycerophosphodiester phosphodiesterase family protein n=1 Tax=Chitinophaga sp. OAE865 TaxID=2817898 RepID=UPI001AE998AB
MKAAIYLAALCCFAINAYAQTLPATRNKFVVVAHRGNHVDVPENTLAAIEETIRCGADYAELDLRTTKDGQLVLMHNATVDKMTDGKGNVADLTLAEIKQLKVRSSDGKVYRVPTFAEALQACKGRLNIYLDFKAADVSETWKQLQAAGMDKQVIVYLNEKEQYKAWHNTVPEVPLMASLPDGIGTPEQLESFLKKVRIAVFDNITAPEMMAVARKYNVAIWLDVQKPNEGPADWQAAVNKGIQGVQTDHPEALIKYLNANHLRDGVTATASLQ